MKKFDFLIKTIFYVFVSIGMRTGYISCKATYFVFVVVALKDMKTKSLYLN